MKVAHLLILALACLVAVEATMVPLHRLQRTPAQKRAYYERIRSGEAARAVAAKYRAHIAHKFPAFASTIADGPADPFKNYDDVCASLLRLKFAFHILTNTLFNFPPSSGSDVLVQFHYDRSHA